MKPETLSQLMAKELPKQKWHVNNLVPFGGITVMSAEPRSYKTWLLLDMALAVAEGKPLFDYFETQQSGVLMVDEENGEGLLQERFKLLDADPKLPIYLLRGQYFQLTEAKVKALIIICAMYGIKLVTFDSLVRVSQSKDENDAMQMATAFRQLKKLSNVGISVVLTHHNRKPSKENVNLSHAMRGSSDIFAAVDSALAVNRNDELVTVTQTKNRFAEECPAFNLQVVTGENEFTFHYVGSAQHSLNKKAKIEQAILATLESGPKNQSDIVAEVRKQEFHSGPHSIKEVLSKIELNGRVEQRPGEKNAKIYRLKP